MISKCRIRDCNVEHPAGWHEREDSNRVRRRIIDLVPELKALFYEQGKVDRTLTISDVLRALQEGQTWYLSQYGNFFKANSASPEAEWNLAVDFDGQTYETKMFIGKNLGL